MGSVGSVQFQIAPYFSLSSRAIGPSQCLVSVNYRVLICCTCHFQSGSLFFGCFDFLPLQVSSVYNFRPDTAGRRCHLFRLTCSVGLWDGKDAGAWGVRGVLAVYGPRWLCPRPRRLRLTGLDCSGSRLLCKGTSQVALSSMPSPGLSRSGSGAPCQGCALPGLRSMPSPGLSRSGSGAPCQGCALPGLHSMPSPGLSRSGSGAPCQGTQAELGRCLVPSPGPGCSGGRVLEEHTVRQASVLNISPAPTRFAGAPQEHRLKCVCPLGR